MAFLDVTERARTFSAGNEPRYSRQLMIQTDASGFTIHLCVLKIVNKKAQFQIA